MRMHQASRKVILKRQFLLRFRAGFFIIFSKYHIKILLGDFNAKLGRENIFKPTIGNDSLHQDSNDNGVRKVNFVISKKSSRYEHNVPAPKHS
jgi:hypothetical protein